MKKSVSVLLSVFILFSALLPGCASADKGSAGQPETRVFVDSVGRSVEVPAVIDSVAPSGPLAQIVLYTFDPDKLAGIAADFSEEAKEYIDERYWGLPKFGQFYGKNASLNMEALAAAAPDVIIDIGETKETEKEDMDSLQEQLGIPTIFISATLDTMGQAYAMLGDLLGEPERAAELSKYCTDTIANADSVASSLTDGEKVSVYMAMGDDGLSTNAVGSIHADVLERVGAVNAADEEAANTGGGTEISFEQLLGWDPDVIIVDGQALYETILIDSAWRELTAVQSGRVYRIPNVPYGFISSPPSVNRIIGINWLGSLLYPDRFTLNISDEVKSFYKLFYSIELTDEEVGAILG